MVGIKGKKHTPAQDAAPTKRVVRRVRRKKVETQEVPEEPTKPRRKRGKAAAPSTSQEVDEQPPVTARTESKAKASSTNTCSATCELREVAEVGECDFCDTYRTHAYKEGNRIVRPYTRVLYITSAKAEDAKGGAKREIRLCKLCQWSTGDPDKLCHL
jgi:type IV secretory pathway VirB10-like protein